MSDTSPNEAPQSGDQQQQQQPNGHAPPQMTLRVRLYMYVRMYVCMCVLVLCVTTVCTRPVRIHHDFHRMSRKGEGPLTAGGTLYCFSCLTISELHRCGLFCHWALLPAHDNGILLNCVLYFHTRVSGSASCMNMSLVDQFCLWFVGLSILFMLPT